MLTRATRRLWKPSDSPSMDVLSDGSTVTFNSAYCQIDVGDTVDVDLISGDRGFAAGDNIVGCAVRSNGATPKKNKVNRTCTISCAGVGTRMLDITLTSASDKWKACHVDLTLTNGDMLGFNFIWNTCDP